MLFSLLHPFTMSTYTSSSSHPSIHTHKEVAWPGTLPLPVCPSVRFSVCFYRLVLSHPLLCVMLMTVKRHRQQQQQQQTNDRPTGRPHVRLCIHLVWPTIRRPIDHTTCVCSYNSLTHVLRSCGPNKEWTVIPAPHVNKGSTLPNDKDRVVLFLRPSDCEPTCLHAYLASSLKLVVLLVIILD